MKKHRLRNSVRSLTGAGFVLAMLAEASTAGAQRVDFTNGDFDEGCVSVLVDDPPVGATGFVIDNGDGTFTVDPQQVFQRFRENHSDDFDFITILPTFDDVVGNGLGADRGRFFLVFNGVSGLGAARPVDVVNRFGAARLEGVVQLANVANTTLFPAFDPVSASYRNFGARFPSNRHSALSLMARQFGRRWSGFAQVPGAFPGGSDAILAGPGTWSFYLNGASAPGSASSLHGNVWPALGALTTSGVTDGYSQLDQYLMGLRDTEAVSNFFYVANPAPPPPPPVVIIPPATAAPAAGVTVIGTRQTVTIADIAAANGARSPASPDARRSFKQAFIVVSRVNDPPATLVSDVDRYRTAWAEYFAEQTNLLGSVDTCVTQRGIDVLFLFDLSGSFSDDLDHLRTPDPVTGDSPIELLVEQIEASSPSTRFGLASFVDFPFPPFGAGTDYTFRVDLPLNQQATDAAQSTAFLAAVDSAVTLSGADTPQNQYEALYQAIAASTLVDLNADGDFADAGENPDGAGLDLNGDGDRVDLGEVSIASIGHNSTRPLFIMLFTDADFHDPDVDPTYPTAAFNGAAHGRSEVLSLFQAAALRASAGPSALALAGASPRPTFIFNILSGLADDTSDITDVAPFEELAAVSGGDVFPVAAASVGFDGAIRSALADTPLPVLEPARFFRRFTIGEAELSWEHQGKVGFDGAWRDLCRGREQGRRHGKHHHGKPSKRNIDTVFEAEGTLELPAGTEFSSIDPTAIASISIADVGVLQDQLTLEVIEVRGRTLWRFHTHDREPGGLDELTLVWKSPSTAEYHVRGTFDAEALHITGKVSPAVLNLSLALGAAVGAQPLSGSATIEQSAWDILNAKRWLEKRRKNHRPYAPSKDRLSKR